MGIMTESSHEPRTSCGCETVVVVAMREGRKEVAR